MVSCPPCRLSPCMTFSFAFLVQYGHAGSPGHPQLPSAEFMSTRHRPISEVADTPEDFYGISPPAILEDDQVLTDALDQLFEPSPTTHDAANEGMRWESAIKYAQKPAELPILPPNADPKMIRVTHAGVPQRYLDYYVSNFVKNMPPRGHFFNMVDAIHFIMGNPLPLAFWPATYGPTDDSMGVPNRVTILLDSLPPPSSGYAQRSDGELPETNFDLFSRLMSEPIQMPFVDWVDAALARDGRARLIEVLDSLVQRTTHLGAARDADAVILRLSVELFNGRTLIPFPDDVVLMMDDLRTVSAIIDEEAQRLNQNLEFRYTITETDKKTGTTVTKEVFPSLEMYYSDRRPLEHRIPNTVQFERLDVRNTGAEELLKAYMQEETNVYLLKKLGLEMIILCKQLRNSEGGVVAVATDNHVVDGEVKAAMFIDIEQVQNHPSFFLTNMYNAEFSLLKPALDKVWDGAFTSSWEELNPPGFKYSGKYDDLPAYWLRGVVVDPEPGFALHESTISAAWDQRLAYVGMRYDASRLWNQMTVAGGHVLQEKVDLLSLALQAVSPMEGMRFKQSCWNQMNGALPIKLRSSRKPRAYRYVIVEMGRGEAVTLSATTLVNRYRRDYGDHQVHHLAYDFDIATYISDEVNGAGQRDHSITRTVVPTEFSIKYHPAVDQGRPLVFDSLTKLILVAKGGRSDSVPTVAGLDLFTLSQAIRMMTRQNPHIVFWPMENTIRELRVLACRVEPETPELDVARRPTFGEDLFSWMAMTQGLKMSRLTTYRDIISINSRGFVFSMARGGPVTKRVNAKRTFVPNQLGFPVEMKRYPYKEAKIRVAFERMLDNEIDPQLWTHHLGRDGGHESEGEQPPELNGEDDHVELLQQPPELSGEDDQVELLSFEVDEATSRDSYTMLDEIAARSTLAHARVALHAWAAGVAVKVHRSMAHIANALGRNKRFVPILSTASVVDAARKEYQMDVLILPDNEQDTHVFALGDISEAHEGTVRTVSLDSDALIQARQLTELAIETSTVAEVTDGPQLGAKIVVDKPDALSAVESPATLAIGLFIISLSRMATHEKSTQFGVSKALSLALEVHTYMNLAQMAFDVTVHNAYTMLNILHELYVMTKIGGSLLARAGMSWKSSAASFSRIQVTANIALLVANIFFDLYEIAAAVNRMQVILYTAQLLVDVNALGILIAALVTGSEFMNFMMLPFAGITMGFTEVISALVQNTANAVQLGTYFDQFDYDYDHPSFFEYDPRTDLQEVNMAFTSHRRASARMNTAVIAVIDVRRNHATALTFGSQMLYQSSKWHKGGNFVSNYAESMDKTAPMINVREALGKEDKMIVPHQPNATVFTLPITATSFIEYHYGPCPAIYWKHYEELDAVRRIEANYPFYFEYWGNDMESLNKLTLKYQPSTIHVKLGSYRRTLLIPALPAVALYNKLTYEITLHDPRVAHTLKVVRHAKYTVQMDKESVDATSSPLHGFALLVEGKPVVNSVRVNRIGDDTSWPTTIIHIHGIAITFIGKFGLVHLTGGKFQASVDLSAGNGDPMGARPQLVLIAVSEQNLEKYPRVVSDHVQRTYGFVEIEGFAKRSRAWYDFATKTHITAPPALAMAHPQLQLLNRLRNGDVVYFAPPHRNNTHHEALYVVSNATGATTPLVFCCPVASPMAATFARNDLLRVRLSDGLILAVEPLANLRVITAINVARKLHMTQGALLSRAKFMRLLSSFASETQYRVGYVVGLLYDDNRARRVQSWYVTSTDEFLDVHHTNSSSVVRLLGWDRNMGDATSTYFLFDPTKGKMYMQKGTHEPQRTTQHVVRKAELVIANLTDATSDGVHAFVHCADGTVSQLSADGTLRLSAVDLTNRTLSLMSTPFITLGGKKSSMPVVNVRGALNSDGNVLNVWYITMLDALIVGDGLLAATNIVYAGEMGTTCYALDPSKHLLYRQTPFKARNSQYYRIGTNGTLSLASSTPARFAAPQRWTPLEFPTGIAPMSAHIDNGKLLIITTANLLFSVDFDSDYAPTLTLMGVSDAWVSQQTQRYPSERLEDALVAVISRVNQQVAPQLLVGTSQKPQKLYDVTHSLLVTSSPERQFLGAQKTPHGDTQDLAAYYFSPREKMVIREPTTVIGSSPGPPFPIVAADHAYTYGDTLIIQPTSPNDTVWPVLPGKNLIVVGSNVGVDENLVDPHYTTVVTAPNDPLNATMHTAISTLKHFARIYQGHCADIHCEPIIDIPTCLIASAAVFGSTPFALNATALEEKWNDFPNAYSNLSHSCAFRGTTLVDDKCVDDATPPALISGCLCRCPNGPSSTLTSSTTEGPPVHACIAPQSETAYNFTLVSANPLTHFAATGITCASGYRMHHAGIVVTPCARANTPYSVRGCDMAPPDRQPSGNALTVRAVTYAAADWDCVGDDIAPSRVFVNWAHMGACLRDFGARKYRIVSCLAPGTLGIQIYKDARCRHAIENHRITRGKCSAATWWLAEGQQMVNTIWDWAGACETPHKRRVEGVCKEHVATLTYNDEERCREDGCYGTRGCLGYIYHASTRTCLLYKYVARPGTVCKELTPACHAEFFRYASTERSLAVIRPGIVHHVTFPKFHKITVQPGCELTLFPRMHQNDVSMPVTYQVETTYLDASWPEDGTIARARVRQLYTCFGERCRSACATSWDWLHTVWCWTEQRAGHSLARKWGLCHCEEGQKEGTPIRGRYWNLPCVYPFIYYGHTYDGYGGNACVESGNGLPSWCATSVYDDKSYKTFNYCDNTNPKLSACQSRHAGRRLTPGSLRGGNKGLRKLAGQDARIECVFPFRFRGRLHFACTHMFDDPTMPPWCSTKVDDDSNHVGILGNYGYCDDSCALDASNDRLCIQKFAPLEFRWNPFGDSLYGMTRNNVCVPNADACRVLGADGRGDLAEECSNGCANGNCASTPCELYTCPWPTGKKIPAPRTCANFDRTTCCCKAYAEASGNWCNDNVAIDGGMLTSGERGAHETIEEVCQEGCTTLSLAEPDRVQVGVVNFACDAFAVQDNTCFFWPRVPRGHTATRHAPSTCQRRICSDEDDNCQRALCGVIHERAKSRCARTCRLCDQCRDPVLQEVYKFLPDVVGHKKDCHQLCFNTVGCTHFTLTMRDSGGTMCMLFRDGVLSETCIPACQDGGYYQLRNVNISRWCGPYIGFCDKWASDELLNFCSNSAAVQNCCRQSCGLCAPPCPELATQYAGNDIFISSNAKSWEHCAHRCARNPDSCKFWTWRGDGKCSLKTSDSGRKYFVNHISGSQSCGSRCLFKRNHVLRGVDRILLQIKTVDATLCCNKCAAISSCVGFTWRFNTARSAAMREFGRCRLKKANDGNRTAHVRMVSRRTRRGVTVISALKISFRCNRGRPGNRVCRPVKLR